MVPHPARLRGVCGSRSGLLQVKGAGCIGGPSIIVEIGWWVLFVGRLK